MQDLVCHVKKDLAFYSDGTRGTLKGFKQESDAIRLYLERSQGLCGDHEWKNIRLEAENAMVDETMTHWCRSSGWRELVDSETSRKQNE